MLIVLSISELRASIIITAFSLSAEEEGGERGGETQVDWKGASSGMVGVDGRSVRLWMSTSRREARRMRIV